MKRTRHTVEEIIRKLKTAAQLIEEAKRRHRIREIAAEHIRYGAGWSTAVEEGGLGRESQSCGTALA